MIRTARWLPLSLAIHAAALGGGVWLVRDIDEPALFIDMRLIESDAPPERAKSPRAGSPAPPAGPVARGAARSAPAAPARETATAPPIAAPAVTPVPSVPPAPSIAPAPSLAPAPPADAAVADAPVSPSGTQSLAASEGVAASDGAHGGAAGQSVAAGLPSGAGGAAARAPHGDASGDGPLALAIPGDGGAGYGPYHAAIHKALKDALEYPLVARRRGLSGTVLLEIAVEATGRVSTVLLVASSSHAVLDEAALEAARRLRVQFPSGLRPRPLRVLMPVVFDLR